VAKQRTVKEKLIKIKMDKNSDKFSLDFEKKNINKTVMSFLYKRFKSEDLKNCVSQTNGTREKLKKGDANMLL